MGGDDLRDASSGDIADGRRRLGMSTMALWLGYITVGGNGTLRDVEAWLADSAGVPDRDHDYLALALNEEFLEQGLDHPMRYRRH